jgi:hypothetical protein
MNIQIFYDKKPWTRRHLKKLENKRGRRGRIKKPKHVVDSLAMIEKNSKVRIKTCKNKFQFSLIYNYNTKAKG